MFWYIALALFAVLAAVAIYDVTQRRHAIIRNFPIIGHLRYWLEAIGPELRQYIVTDNDEERPFNRDQRRWVYASSKRENNYFGFGTDNDMELRSNYLVIKHSAFPLNSPHPGDQDYDSEYLIPCAKVWGAARGRKKAFRPKSAVYVSAMSFGSLSGAAVESMNRGCASAQCLHNTGEGGMSPFHAHGAELIWQIGTGYYGCRDDRGRFDMKQLAEAVEQKPQIKAIEIKLSQGAKPGKGGILPRSKITPEIAKIRQISMEHDCVSPASHSSFRSVDEMLDFVERIADETGLPVGVKSAVGEAGFWHELATLISTTDRSVDYIAIDGGEGGTGAAPLAFSDHVSLPFKLGFSRVYKTFMEFDLQQQMVFVGAGKLGFPEESMFAFALGCDMIAVAREAMLSIGCIQAQRCHSNHCPAGIATQNWWLARGVDPTLKSARLANYVRTLRQEILSLTRACGAPHPAMITPNHLEIVDDRFNSKTLAEIFQYDKGLRSLSDADEKQIREMMPG